MIYVPDTNVFEERLRKTPDPGVTDFFRRLPSENVRLCSIVLAEIAQGVENNPIPALQTFLAETLRLPVAEFGELEALEWGRLVCEGFRRKIDMQTRDTILAATANVRGWTVATRNEKHFRPLGVLVFNPWKERLG